MTDSPTITETEGYTPGQLADELHQRFARALICIAVTMIGFSSLMLGGYSRFGVWRQALLAFVLLIFLEVLRGLVSEPILKNADLWPLIYVPTLVGLLIASLFLKIASRPLKLLLRRRIPQSSGVGT